jgi:hypothetical protein
MRKLLPALILSAVVLAQSNPNGGTADAEKKKIRIEGRVISLNGEVVRKANVRLQPAGGLQFLGPPANGAAGNQPPSTYSESSAAFSDHAGKISRASHPLP